MEIRKYNDEDVSAMIHIWNEVVKEGVAFPQEDCLDEKSGKEFFAAQSYCGVAVEDNSIVGLYILHPNYIGRLGHISNACQLCGGLQVPREAYRRKVGFRLSCAGKKAGLWHFAV